MLDNASMNTTVPTSLYAQRRARQMSRIGAGLGEGFEGGFIADGNELPALLIFGRL